MIIRHGEKPTEPGPAYGITIDGVQDPGSLTTTGWARAPSATRDPLGVELNTDDGAGEEDELAGARDGC